MQRMGRAAENVCQVPSMAPLYPTSNQYQLFPQKGLKYYRNKQKMERGLTWRKYGAKISAQVRCGKPLACDLAKRYWMY